MPRTNLDDLNAFLAVAKERSFTRAAAKLGVSQSALSHTIRGLESRLGLRLLTRTTRSVSPTETGERLLRSIGPRLDEIDAELEAVSALRDKPIGTIRLTAGEHSARHFVAQVVEGAAALRLVPEICGLSSLLSKSAAADTGVFGGGRRVALSTTPVNFRQQF